MCTALGRGAPSCYHLEFTAQMKSKPRTWPEVCLKDQLCSEVFMEKEKKKNFHSLLNHFCLHVSISLPLLSSEHPTTQPSHHFILLTYITLITALADRLCADLEILSLVLPPTRF